MKKTFKKNEIFLTEENVINLKTELKNLKEVKRPKLLEELKSAREQGDLSENAEYDAAKEKQSLIEKRINEINIILDNYNLVHNSTFDKVKIGSIVKFKILDTNHIYTVKIGTDVDVDVDKNIISRASILGRTIFNLKVDNVAFVSNPGKSYKIKILEIN